jgi:hypothetical protein
MAQFEGVEEKANNEEEWASTVKEGEVHRRP